MSQHPAEFPSSPLIFAGKVCGTPVFDESGERVGHIQDIALSKANGQVAYAILTFGGVLGVGERHYPIPWRSLTYDTARNAYTAALDKRDLKEAPSFALDELADVGDSDERQKSWAEHWGPFI
ncbi:MAG TPA: PRC-barrel domain-containing protein [Caulobacteraceae bacterium]|nr:PRC-barrel domain-containing protein [Caulobacteraceae bacterium]